MEKNLSVIASSPLFHEIDEKDVAAMLHCLKGYRRSYRRGETVRPAGEIVSALGLVLKGGVFLSVTDYGGNETLLDRVEAGRLFGETAACLDAKKSDIAVTAAADTEILFLDVSRVAKTCSSACTFHQRVIRNLLLSLARENDELHHKVEHLSKRTTREKLLSYLTSYAGEEGAWFSIPLNRQQLADYLCVDRSAMSWELCRMRDRGILELRKNHFRFLRPFNADLLS